MGNLAALRLISRNEIAEVLRKWQLGLLTAEHVHNWAGARYLHDDVDYDDEENDEHSVANEVMAHLDLLDMNLMVAEDIPIYLEFLETPAGQFEQGCKKFNEALDRIEIEARRQQLTHIPLYAPYCK
ncbi:MAG TPA: hypothetical protein VGZ47_18045 [Gemmataceae bacterium]|jgi:hypothetical protein|nr:hypothetical protein [Gemmataceae bacterium]